MKIAFLTSEYPHEKTGNAGGIGTSIKTLANALTSLDHEVRVIVYGQKSDAIFNDGKIIVHQIKNIKFKGLSWYFTQKKIEKNINQLHFEGLIDVVEAPDWTGITSFIKPKKCPIVIKLHGSDTYFCYLDKRPVKRWNKFLEKRALQHANGFISVSKFTANLTNQLFNLEIPFKILPNGIDSNQFNANHSTNEYSSGKIVVLYFGTLIRKKGLLELPHIFNLVHEQNQTIELHLIGKDSPDIISGNSSTWQMMQELFTHNALEKVNYHGAIPYHEMKNKIASATICVFPTFAEALPVSWLEAMAMEKAIVASNIGWASEIISNHKDGVLINPKEHQLYANEIVNLINSTEKRIELSKHARSTIEQEFNIQKIAQSHIEYYNEIIKHD